MSAARIEAARAAVAAAGGPSEAILTALDAIRELREELTGLRGERDTYAAELDLSSRELAAARAELRDARGERDRLAAALDAESEAHARAVERAVSSAELARELAGAPSDETDNRPPVNPSTGDQD